MAVNESQLIHDLMNDVNGAVDDSNPHDIETTIKDILNKYNLSTDLTFIEKIGNLKFSDKQESIDLSVIPKELKDASYLPVNTIADIALRQDLELMVSQIPEWHTTLQVMRDTICEADIVNGTLARTLSYDNASMSDDEKETAIKKNEAVEDKLELHTLIKNHIVYNTLLEGEGYLYTIPYSKVFYDLYKYRVSALKSHSKDNTSNMFETSSSLQGYGYGESAIEKSLSDVSVVNDSSTNSKSIKSAKNKKRLKNNVFTEQEIIEINPGWESSYVEHDGDTEESKKIFEQTHQENNDKYDECLKAISDNIRYIDKDIAIPVIEESAIDLQMAYKTKYNNQYQKDVGEVKTFFESVMVENGDNTEFNQNFANVKGVYLKILPATKLIPIRVDRTVIGYYYISDLTRPESQGERKNSGLSGYTLRTPSIGYDTFSPDRMFCEKLANKIINNFDMKFMRDNTSLHEQIVAILQAHKFNESLMRFIFIPAEHICQFTINKDGEGRGHSMLEPGLVTARMYMFLKLYSILYQINNAAVRVYNLRMSGMDTNYKQLVQETMRKFAARRVTANDIFNYRSSLTKVSGGSELIMPMGSNDTAPLTFDTIEPANAPINNDLLDGLKHETLDSSPVPSAMVMGGASEMEFAKEVELSNTRMNSAAASYKIEFNRDITLMYRKIMRWETDIDPTIIATMRFQFRNPAAKHLNITNEMIGNFNAIMEVINNTFLTKAELAEDDPNKSTVLKEYNKLCIAELLPQVDIGRFEELAKQARQKANAKILDDPDHNKEQNLLDDETGDDEGLV